MKHGTVLCIHTIHTDSCVSATEDEARSVEHADSSQGSEMSTPCPQTASTAPRCGDLSTPRSRHAAGGCPMDGYRSRSRGRSSRGYRHRSRSRHSGSRHTDRSRSRHGGSRQTDRSRSRHGGSRHTDRHDGSHRTDAYRCDERSRHSDLTSPPYDGPRHDAVTDLKWTFPLPTDVFQKKVLTLLFDLHNQYKKAEPASSAVHILRMETMVDFEAEEQRLCDAQAFDTLVLQIARIGGKNTKDCVHKVLDRYVSTYSMNCGWMGALLELFYSGCGPACFHLPFFLLNPFVPLDKFIAFQFFMKF
ncbi:uncharacterized protein LOC120535855 [Polypterus senegalus]|uniref:uncharacterized protein LOC120535855 n=1 Tax=Polypterus senegalus TaxID=55291 RepID=UPI0019646DA2|nr:uncharacterized protein LOC120535855 [Polypterus senegalus]XP_039619906.1 uncharacterized protein LOC120535855 [Polypterus senegalus]